MYKCSIKLGIRACTYCHPRNVIFTWWRHQMEIFSALLALSAGNSPMTGEFPSQRPATRSFDVFFDPRLNKQLSKQSWGWWFETPSCSLWCHCNVRYNLWIAFYDTKCELHHCNGVLHHWWLVSIGSGKTRQDKPLFQAWRNMDSLVDGKTMFKMSIHNDWEFEKVYSYYIYIFIYIYIYIYHTITFRMDTISPFRLIKIQYSPNTQVNNWFLKARYGTLFLLSKTLLNSALQLFIVYNTMYYWISNN